MKIKSLPKPIGNYFLMGILIVALSQLFARFIPMADFVRGALMGVGIGLEIIAVIKLSAFRKNMHDTIENQ